MARKWSLTERFWWNCPLKCYPTVGLTITSHNSKSQQSLAVLGSESVVFTQKGWWGAHTHQPRKLKSCLWLEKICAGGAGDNDMADNCQTWWLTASPLPSNVSPSCWESRTAEHEKRSLDDFAIVDLAAAMPQRPTIRAQATVSGAARSLWRCWLRVGTHVRTSKLPWQLSENRDESPLALRCLQGRVVWPQNRWRTLAFYKEGKIELSQARTAETGIYYLKKWGVKRDIPKSLVTLSEGRVTRQTNHPFSLVSQPCVWRPASVYSICQCSQRWSNDKETWTQTTHILFSANVCSLDNKVTCNKVNILNKQYGKHIQYTYNKFTEA